jgi:hypothetical protein
MTRRLTWSLLALLFGLCVCPRPGTGASPAGAGHRSGRR